VSNTGMRVEHIRVFGFEPAFRDLRNPKESWCLSDSRFYEESPIWTGVAVRPWNGDLIRVPEHPFIGPVDMKLACNLIRGGGAERKFIREISIHLSLLVPRCHWQEQDTYKIGTIRNSCSTMHKLGSRDLTVADFADGDVRRAVLADLNDMGRCYRLWLTPAGKDDPAATYRDPENGLDYRGVPLLRHMKFNLPESYLQRAGYVFNYEAAIKMFYDRRAHRMLEWSGPGGLCEVIQQLPYMDQFLEAAAKQRG
jgi:hypothetical protein